MNNNERIQKIAAECGAVTNGWTTKKLSRLGATCRYRYIKLNIQKHPARLSKSPRQWRGRKQGLRALVISIMKFKFM